MWTDLASYSGLFLAALLAASLFPAQSEAVLAALVLAGEQPVWALLAVATLGNVMGSLANWWLGRFIGRFQSRRWFPVSPLRLQQATGWYQRFGIWSLLLSWVPVIGDPITLVAGVLRTPFWPFLLLVTLAKLGRYLVLAVTVQGLI